MNMPEVEERLGRLEVQVDRVQKDVQEIKGNLNAVATEMRSHAAEDIERFHALELSLRNGRGSDLLRESGNGAGRLMATAAMLGRHVDKAGKWLLIGILAYLLKIITIDVDLPRLNKVVGTYEALNGAGAVELPASPPVR